MCKKKILLEVTGHWAILSPKTELLGAILYYEFKNLKILDDSLFHAGFNHPHPSSVLHICK
jgi:hypothetical protein